MGFYNRDYEIQTKADKSPVTEADFAVDRLLQKELQKYGWPILSEEMQDDLGRMKSDYVWIIDPIDGTKDFINKTDTFTVVLGLVYKGKSVLGMVYEPVTKTLYFAQEGKGAYMQVDKEEAKQITVAQTDSSSQATMVASEHHFTDAMKIVADGLHVEEFLKTGGTARKIVLVALGKADIWFSTAATMGQWDTCAAHCILEEAGGVFTDMFGESVLYNGLDAAESKGFVVTNGIIHTQVIDVIKEKKLSPL